MGGGGGGGGGGRPVHKTKMFLNNYQYVLIC